jgi:hypothetical protein
MHNAEQLRMKMLTPRKIKNTSHAIGEGLFVLQAIPGLGTIATYGRAAAKAGEIGARRLEKRSKSRNFTFFRIIKKI